MVLTGCLLELAGFSLGASGPSGPPMPVGHLREKTYPGEFGWQTPVESPHFQMGSPVSFG